MRGSTPDRKRDLLAGALVLSALASVGGVAVRYARQAGTLARALAIQSEEEAQRELGAPTDAFAASEMEAIRGRYAAQGYDLTEVRLATERFVLYRLPLSAELLVLCCTRHGRIVGRQILAPK